MKVLLTTLNAKYIHSALSLKYLSAAAEDAGLTPEVREFTINDGVDRIYMEILRSGCDLACFSCYIWNIEEIKELCSDLKKAEPGLSILLGGPEVSYGTGEFMEKCPWADFIIRGEGEYPFAEFCREIMKPNRNFSGIPSLTYREKGRIIENPRCGPLPPGKIPFPYRKEPEKDKILYYETSRGCPYNCSYCLSSAEKSVRPLPLGRVLRELRYFLDRDVKQVKLVDRTFNYDAERALAIWEYLINNDNGITNFHFEIRGDLIDICQTELLAKARKGLFQLEIGIQSMNPAVLSAVNRNSETDRLSDNILKLKSLGNIHLHTDLIAGLPLEDHRSFGKSFDAAYCLGADELQVGFLKVLKGTQIEREKEKYGILCRDKAPWEIIRNSHISPGELVKIKMVEKVHKLYANRGGFPRTLQFLIAALGGSPFGFFSRFSEFFYEEGFQRCPRKKEDLYRIMLKFAQSVQGREGMPLDISEKAKDLLERDMEDTMDFEVVKRFYKKGWEISGI